jgi:hypothetical protein
MESVMQSFRGAQEHKKADVAHLTHLAQAFRVSRELVQGVYEEQYRRLSESARIHQYVDLLAFKNTRQALHAIAQPSRLPSYQS